MEGFSAIDGYLAHNLAWSMLRSVFMFFINNKVNVRDYLLSSKLYNIRNCYLFYRTQDKEWSEYLQAEGFKYSSFDTATTPYTELGEINKKNLNTQVELHLANKLFLAFGMNILDYLTLDNCVIDKIKAAMGEVQKFTLEEYHQKVYGL